MTIEQKAREIAMSCDEGGTPFSEIIEAARLGIIEGLEMAERKLAECYTTAYARGIIRALIEEQKV